jgi:aldehyde dehydrogenase (NAD+)
VYFGSLRPFADRLLNALEGDLMSHAEQHYIDGIWTAPAGDGWIEVVDPSTEQPFARVPAGTAAEVGTAVAAARAAFPAWARTAVAERAALLVRLADGLTARRDEIAEVISREMGMPRKLALHIQASLPVGTCRSYARLAREVPLAEQCGTTRVVREPIGVCGFITPWNFPLHQVVGKVAPALAAGCTMVLKPSEVAPLDAVILAEVLADVGLPPGVFNLVHGEGPVVGAALAAHPDLDMISFTGSTRAGVAVAKAAADSVKRVTQELGGKSPNLLLDDADFPRAVAGGVRSCYLNSGQACSAPTRMLVPADRHEEAAELARRAAEAMRVGDPTDPASHLGPLAHRAQFEKVQRLITRGIDEGARLVTGGPGRPEGLERGFYARPTVFAEVSNAMTIAREEIFGPVLSILPYADEEEAIAIANDTDYGLAAYVSSGNLDRARRVATRLRAGQVEINGAAFDPEAPFGGYKRSGNGREFGRWGLEEYLETKAIVGYGE